MNNLKQTEAQCPLARAGFGWLLLLGLALRLAGINQPLIDSGLFRQGQTADATRSLIEEPGWHWSSSVSWRGDTNARIVLELPIYNYLVVAVHAVLGHLDMSGKLVSVALWGFSFWLLQNLWRRMLAPRPAFWANLLFVLSPIEVFYGQAFMPETLIQALAFGFILAAVRYAEQPTRLRLLVCAATGLVGLLVKTPEIIQWYLVVWALVFEKEQWRCFWRLRYLVALIVTVALVKGWSVYVEETNLAEFPTWTSKAVLAGFLGPWWARFSLHHATMVAKYLAIFTLSAGGVAFAALGLVVLLRQRHSRLALFWLGALVVYYLLWAGPVSNAHSYYHLPAIGPGSLLFGLGVTTFLDWSQQRWSGQWGAWAPRVVVLFSTVPLLLIVSLYMFRQDRVIYESALWARDHVPAGEMILLKCNHRPDAIGYPHLCTFPYYAQRRVWVYNQAMPESTRQRAVATARWAIVTRSAREVSYVERWRRKLRFGSVLITPDNMDWLEQEAGYARFLEAESFTVYRKAALAPADRH